MTATGTNALPNGYNGISLSSAVLNLIGGSVSGARNVISGNTYNGVEIYLLTDAANTISGNYIGTDITGAKAVANSSAGVFMQGCSNIVGGVTAGSGNVISGNIQGHGVLLYGNNVKVTGNIIQGNIIGLDATGANGLGNGDAGMGIYSAANNQIGGTTAGARNIISANHGGGIYRDRAGSTNNVVQGNYIGTDKTGMSGRGNAGTGHLSCSQPANWIGGSAPAPGI